MRYLFRASFSPVQTFIAQGRKLQDLYAGSYILSHLAKTMINAAAEDGAVILYPQVSETATSCPNLFMAIVEKETKEQLRAFAQRTEDALRHRWQCIANEVMRQWALVPNDAFNDQIDHLWQFYWAAEAYENDADYRTVFVETLRKMGAAKTLRSFRQLSQKAGRKCDLAPTYNALFCRKRKGFMHYRTTYELNNIQTYDYPSAPEEKVVDNKYIREHETLCGISFVKRSLGKAIREFNDNFPDTAAVAGGHTYYALVQFDGDNMGSLYSTDKVASTALLDFQINLSRMVSASSTKMSALKREEGVVIYAGGDDFLGAMPLETVFKTLKKLRITFQETMQIEKYISTKATFSAGIVIAHIKTPLVEVLKYARESESKAKAVTGKNAYCLTILKHSGEILQYTHSFSVGEMETFQAFIDIIDIIVNKKVSTNFIYQLAEEFRDIDSTHWRTMLLLEARRLLKHAETTEVTVAAINTLLHTLIKGGDSQSDFLHLLCSVAFIARQRRGGVK